MEKLEVGSQILLEVVAQERTCTNCRFDAVNRGDCSTICISTGIDADGNSCDIIFKEVKSDKSSECYDPEVGDTYWYFDELGQIEETINGGLILDLMSKNCGNCFGSEKLAEESMEIIKERLGL